ncbi:MAG TPA: hypothetical protein VGM88_23740 [Kofleriaceae bacterium]
MRRLALLLVVLAACGDSAIELSLALPESNTDDISCVTAVEVWADGEDTSAVTSPDGLITHPPTDIRQCIAVSNLTSWSAVQSALAGKFELKLPATGLTGFEVRGFSGTCDGSQLGDTIFYGGATSDGNDVTIQLVPARDCSDRTTLTVRPIDYATLAGGTCPGPISDGSSVENVLLRPSGVRGMWLDDSASRAVTTGGTASVDAFSSVSYPANDHSCDAIYVNPSDDREGITCISTAASICAMTGETEVGVIDGDAAYAATDKTLFAKYHGIVFGAVWAVQNGDTDPTPLAGATITFTDASEGEVVYIGPTFHALSNQGATNSNGMFALYTNAATDITVSASGFAPKQVRVAAWPKDPSVVLVRMTN